MSRLIDADEVVAMLEKEAREWQTASNAMASESSRRAFYCIAKGYECAAQDVATMANEQADGSVPTDKVE